MSGIVSFNNSNFLIVGLARNCGKHIQNEVETINKAFSDGKSTKWLIIESDSDDNTLVKLESLKSKVNLNNISLGRLRDDYPKRTERIAVCRNMYLDEIRRNNDYANIDYVVVADLDGVNSKLSSESVKSCWHSEYQWDACFANQSAPYYDIWALRHTFWSPNNCVEQERYLRSLGLDEFSCRYVSVLSRMVTIPINAKPIKVKSAFGGLGIYKKDLLNEGEYIGLNEEGDEVCEHVYFHVNHCNRANLFIIPSLVNCNFNKHSKLSKFSYRVLLYIATRFLSIQKIIEINRVISKIINCMTISKNSNN